MRVDDFDFELPDARIALRPAEPRDAARLLVVRPGEGRVAGLQDRIVRDLPELLAPGDVLVLNDTRVIPARLHARRRRGEAVAGVEILLHKREGAARWRAFARPAKKLAAGDPLVFGDPASDFGAAEAVVVDKGEAGEVTLDFALSGPDLDLAIARIGEMPLPPYIAGKRAADARDLADYQTIYAHEAGAVAAPTAGLHFTDDLFARLDARGVERRFVTLHVGAGTFLPVKVEDTAEPRMHAEWGTITAQTADALNAARARGGRIVAVGTTSLRLLESAAREDGTIPPFSGDTDIFITPGFRFRAVDVLMTNFHLPRSTLMMLVSAFAGFETMRAAYAHAIVQGYRFYSFGDSSLLFRDEPDGAPPVRRP